LRGAQEQVEISKRVKVSEVRAIVGDHIVMCSAESLGPAQRVPYWLIQEPGEQHAEEAVPELVQKPHRLVFHRVDESGTRHEFPLSASDRRNEPWQDLRRNRKVGVENKEDIARRFGESFPYRVALPDPTPLSHQLYVALRMEPYLILDLLCGAIGRVALDEYDLGAGAHLRCAANSVGDVASLVPGRDDDAYARALESGRRPGRPADDELDHSEVGEWPEPR